MNDLPAESLTDRDRLIIREAREEIEASPPPARRGPRGWLAGIVGLIVLLGWPALVDSVPGGDFVNPFVLMGGLLLLVGGPAYGLLGGGSAHASARAAVEAALRVLEAGEGEREELLRAATLLLAHAYVGDGTTKVRTFDPVEARGRIGAGLPLVTGVERYLVEAFSGYPVFSLGSGAAPGLRDE